MFDASLINTLIGAAVGGGCALYGSYLASKATIQAANTSFILEMRQSQKRQNDKIESVVQMVSFEIATIDAKVSDFLQSILVIYQDSALYGTPAVLTSSLSYDDSINYIYKSNLAIIAEMNDKNKLDSILHVYHYLTIFLNCMSANAKMNKMFDQEIKYLHSNNKAEEEIEAIAFQERKKLETFFQSRIIPATQNLKTALDDFKKNTVI